MIRIDVNGKPPRIMQTRNINVSFFVNERLISGYLDLHHFSEEKMADELFTKPLKGSLLWSFQVMIIKSSPEWRDPRLRTKG